MPMSSASEMSRSVPAPSTNAPMNRIDATGRTRDDRRVDRAHQGLVHGEVDRLAEGAPDSRPSSAVFSRILSNTTTVS